MTKIFPKFGRKTAADEISYQIHQMRLHGKLNDIDQREEKELVDAIRSKFPDDKFIDTHRLYNEVFKPLGYREGDLLIPKEIEEVGEKIGLLEEDLEDFRNHQDI